MNSEKDHLFDDIDWADLCIRLDSVVSRCAAEMPDVFDGISTEDIVNQVFIAFFADPNHWGWNPDVGPLDRFLTRALKWKTVDHIRRQRRIAGSLDDPEFAQGIHLGHAANTDQNDDELHAKLSVAARGDPSLEELVKGIAKVDGGHNVNQQLAEELKTTPQDIVNRKKRLIRRLQKEPTITLS